MLHHCLRAVRVLSIEHKLRPMAQRRLASVCNPTQTTQVPKEHLEFTLCSAIASKHHASSGAGRIAKTGTPHEFPFKTYPHTCDHQGRYLEPSAGSRCEDNRSSTLLVCSPDQHAAYRVRCSLGLRIFSKVRGQYVLSNKSNVLPANFSESFIEQQ